MSYSTPLHLLLDAIVGHDQLWRQAPAPERARLALAQASWRELLEVEDLTTDELRLVADDDAEMRQFSGVLLHPSCTDDLAEELLEPVGPSRIASVLGHAASMANQVDGAAVPTLPKPLRDRIVQHLIEQDDHDDARWSLMDGLAASFPPEELAPLAARVVPAAHEVDPGDSGDNGIVAGIAALVQAMSGRDLRGRPPLWLLGTVLGKHDLPDDVQRYLVEDVLVGQLRWRARPSRGGPTDQPPVLDQDTADALYLCVEHLDADQLAQVAEEVAKMALRARWPWLLDHVLRPAGRLPTGDDVQTADVEQLQWWMRAQHLDEQARGVAARRDDLDAEMRTKLAILPGVPAADRAVVLAHLARQLPEQEAHLARLACNLDDDPHEDHQPLTSLPDDVVLAAAAVIGTHPAGRRSHYEPGVQAARAFAWLRSCGRTAAAVLDLPALVALELTYGNDADHEATRAIRAAHDLLGPQAQQTARRLVDDFDGSLRELFDLADALSTEQGAGA